MMARVEGMPLDALEAGPAWDWRTFGEWLDRLDGRLGVNAGLPRRPLDDATRRDGRRRRRATPPRPSRSPRWSRLVHEALRRGRARVLVVAGRGAHRRRRQPGAVARRGARRAPRARARAVRDHAGTTLEFIAGDGRDPADRIELMTDMSLAANRPLNWNLLGSLSPTQVFEQQLTSCDHAAARGAHVVALDAARRHAPARQPHARRACPGWRDVVALPDARAPAARSPTRDARERLRDGAAEAARRGLGRGDAVSTCSRSPMHPPGPRSSIGRIVADVAAERGADPSTC